MPLARSGEPSPGQPVHGGRVERSLSLIDWPSGSCAMLGLAIPVMRSIAKPVAAAVEPIDVAGRLCLMLININFNFQ